MNSGTDVTIQAISTSGAASITLDSPLTIAIGNSATKNPTFTLEANRNITIAKSITTSGSKGLNIMLNADTDGDGIGAVIVNADITTNGGSFTSLTGGDVTHTSNGEKGAYNAVNVGGGPAHDDITKKIRLQSVLILEVLPHRIRQKIVRLILVVVPSPYMAKRQSA